MVLMKKGYKKVRNCYAVPTEFNLSRICNIRNDVAMNRNESRFLTSNLCEYNLDFTKELESSNDIFYINLSCEKNDELIEVDKKDLARFIIQDSTLYFKK